MISISPTEYVFVLTGAGVSAESGIPTFRDAGGIWSKWRPEEIATPEAFRADPKKVWEFYSERRRKAGGVSPNPAHFALAELESRLGEHLLVCTQNVDPLHERAGSRRVIHMHGELMKSRCDRCCQPAFADEQTYFERVPQCSCGGKLRPHVCWFGEIPYEMDAVLEALQACNVFVTVGSSGTVQPAASFAAWAGTESKSGAARKYYIGAEEPANADLFDEVLVGKAGELLPGLFAV